MIMEEIDTKKKSALSGKLIPIILTPIAIILDQITKCLVVNYIPRSDIPPFYGQDAEIGYLLTPEYESGGIMTEATILFCELVFDTLNLRRITSKVCVPNIASWRVLEKNGFQQEGLIRQGFVKNGQVYDYKIMGKLKE